MIDYLGQEVAAVGAAALPICSIGGLVSALVALATWLALVAPSWL